MGSTSQVQLKRPAAPGMRRTISPRNGTSSNSSFPVSRAQHAAEDHLDEEYPRSVLEATIDLGNEAPCLEERNGAAGGQILEADSAADEAAETGVSAEVAEEFIASKRIGDRIKYLRQRKQMGLVELGRYTGLSASFLSQLETGRVVPTLRNLARLAMVFSKDLSYFFEPERPELFRILRADERTRHPQTGAEEPGYFFESLGHVPMDYAVAPYFAEFLPGNGRSAPRAHQHAGAEFFYMLTGQLQITHNNVVTEVQEGDAVYFNSSAAHSYERVGDQTCTALILTMPEPLRGVHTGARVPQVSAAKLSAAASPSS